MDLEEMRWFPKVAASSVTEGEAAPTGFAAKVLHVRWDSIPMLIPEGDLTSEDWWSHQSSTWGEWPELSPLEMKVTPAGWEVDFDAHFAIILPLDGDGHGRRLAELGCDVLHTAIGGMQHEGRDVILIFEKEEGKAIPMNANSIREAGAALGRFHAKSATVLSTPNDERSWNNRNAMLERRTRSATVWRGPHSGDTQGTITHRNFSHSVCKIVDGAIRIGGCFGGVHEALVPENSPFPAIRDVGAAYASMLGKDPEFRKSFYEGWISTAPAHWYSSKAVDTHRGGVMIWEYEQILQHRLFNQAWGRSEPGYITRWLAGVSGLQNGMYQARILAVAGLICFAIIPVAAFYWAFYPESPTPSISDIGAMGALGACGYLLRRMYRASAPDPW